MLWRCSVVSVRSSDERVGFVVADKFFSLWIERQRAAWSRRDVAQMTEDRREVAGECVGGICCRAADGVAEILNVQCVVRCLQFDGGGRWLIAVVEDFQLRFVATAFSSSLLINVTRRVSKGVSSKFLDVFRPLLTRRVK